MNPSLITHGAWSFAALGTFALGYVLAKPAGPDGSTGTTRSLTVSGGQAAVSKSSPLGARQAAGTGADTAAEGASGSRAGSLTPEAIDALAKDAFCDPNPLTRSLAFAKLLESMTPENAPALM